MCQRGLPCHPQLDHVWAVKHDGLSAICLISRYGEGLGAKAGNGSSLSCKSGNVNLLTSSRSPLLLFKDISDGNDWNASLKAGLFLLRCLPSGSDLNTSSRVLPHSKWQCLGMNNICADHLLSFSMPCICLLAREDFHRHLNTKLALARISSAVSLCPENRNQRRFAT